MGPSPTDPDRKRRMMPHNNSGVSERDEQPAGTGVESPSPEAEDLIPLFNTNDEFLRTITEHDARELFRAGRGKLMRSNSGRLRRVYLLLTQADRRDPAIVAGGSVITDASRTVRKQHLTPPLWCFDHIRQDLAVKRVVTTEELAADGVLPGQIKKG